ncbi:MAG: GNAT family N-acetyltransferase [Candidatus Hodarchaeota archaeon]
MTIKNCNLDIHIRPSVVKDIDKFNEIETACFSLKYRYGPSILLSLIETAMENMALTAQYNDSIVGFIIGEIDYEQGKLGRIITIQVDPLFQRKSIGHQLLSSIENQFIICGADSIELHVHFQNETAISFYKNHGYECKKQLKDYYSRQEHALLMQKKKLHDKKEKENPGNF